MSMEQVRPEREVEEESGSKEPERFESALADPSIMKRQKKSEDVT